MHHCTHHCTTERVPNREGPQARGSRRAPPNLRKQIIAAVLDGLQLALHSIRYQHHHIAPSCHKQLQLQS